MSQNMRSPVQKQPPLDWWLENSCRIAAFRLRDHRYMGANVITIREQIGDSVEFVRVVWEEIQKQMKDQEI